MSDIVLKKGLLKAYEEIIKRACRHNSLHRTYINRINSFLNELKVGGKMLELRAILDSFAEFKGIPSGIEDYELEPTDGNSSEGSSSLLFESELTTVYKARPLMISLVSAEIDPMFRTFGPMADLRMKMGLGEIIHPERANEDIARAREDFAPILDAQEYGKFEFLTWEDEEGSSFVGVSLAASGVSFSGDHVETLDFYLQWLSFAGKSLLKSSVGSFREWEEPKAVNYHSLIWQAAESYDRLFKIGSTRYLESALEPMDWGIEGASWDDPESIPKEFLQAEFLEKAVWEGVELLDTEEVRWRVFDKVAAELNLVGTPYSDEDQMLWIVNNEIVTAGAIFMSINSGLTGGSREWFKIPDGASEYLE
ncbi:hypothetical protein [Aquiluna sp. KACHI24]|uniref:hypothetical protein n=1 Tax=Aquiluna sp. KACHI24 TaxID=2968831 RepID=UPI0021F9CA43|nr:hypothetical protein [Aquiluna sp. KACHI24]BDQ00730.1 hypothetical protein AKACHI_10660 [Aquiluna sp. KACHI24]